ITVLIVLVTVRLGVFEDFHRLALLPLQRLPLCFIKLALFPVVFPGVEDQMQPRYHLFDRRKLTGRSRLAARASFTLRPGLSRRPGLTAVTLRAGFSRRPHPAARAVRPAPPGMTLRPHTSRLALLAARAGRSQRSLSSLPVGRFVHHLHAPDDFDST